MSVRFPHLAHLRANVTQALGLLASCVKDGGKILICGNGGSAADAEHIVGELMKSFLLPRNLPASFASKFETNFPEYGQLLCQHLQQAIPAISLMNSVSFSTAFSNDENAEYSLAQQVWGLGQPADVLWGISTSGRSLNIIHAMRVAQLKGMKTLGMTGRDGGEMAGLCDVELRMPCDSTPAIQEMHLPVYHALCAELEEILFGTSFVTATEAITPLTNHYFNITFIPELVVFDFDGVMTDNTVYTDASGNETVACSRSDGLGISMLRKANIPMCILSTETNKVVEARANKLNIHCYQGNSDKSLFLRNHIQNLHIAPERVIYVGNDLNDFEVMKWVGCSVAPADAHPEILKIASVILKSRGGHGAVREICDTIMNRVKN